MKYSILILLHFLLIFTLFFFCLPCNFTLFTKIWLSFERMFNWRMCLPLISSYLYKPNFSQIIWLPCALNSHSSCSSQSTHLKCFEISSFQYTKDPMLNKLICHLLHYFYIQVQEKWRIKMRSVTWNKFSSEIRIITGWGKLFKCI